MEGWKERKKGRMEEWKDGKDGRMEGWRIQFTHYALRFTLHASRFTFHVSRFTLHVLRMILLLIPCLSIAEGDEATKYPFTFVDNLGREVTLPSVPQRIVSIGPANTEILFAIGAGEWVVGVDRFSDYPPAAKQLEQVGGLISPAFDKVVALNPDLVIVGISIDRDSIDKLASLGLNVALIAPSNLNDIYKAIQLIGQMTHRQSQSEKVVADMQARVKAVRAVVAKIPKEQRLRVFYELWHDPLRSAGPGSFIHDLMEMAGGINIAGDTKTPWPHFSLETLVARDPQAIFITRKESLQELKDGHRKLWSGLAAVRTSRIYLLNGDEISRPGPRSVRALEAIVRALYPEQFKEEMEGRK